MTRRQVPTAERLHALGLLARYRGQRPADVPWAACGGFPAWAERCYLDGYQDGHQAGGAFVLPNTVRPQ